MARGVLMRRLEIVCWGCGLALVGAALGIAGDALWYQRRATAALRSALVAPPAGPPVAPGVAVPAGTPLARLLVPRLGTRVVVAEGADDAVLRRAAGRLPSSARFGEEGNVVVAGHRDTFFRSLEAIRAGDRVVIERGGRRVDYEVEWVAVVEPSRVEVARDAGYAALTLVTCFPFDYVGEAPYRFVARARRVADVELALGGNFRRVRDGIRPPAVAAGEPAWSERRDTYSAAPRARLPSAQPASSSR